METLAALPASMHKLLEGRGNFILAQESDLDEKRKFGKGYLILTDTHLLTAKEGGLLAEHSLESLREVKVEELVGGGRLTAVTDLVSSHLLYYSNHRVPHFAAMARFITEWVQKRNPQRPEEQKHAYCGRCRRPLPERDTVCPLCVPRLQILKRILSLTLPYRTKVVGLITVTALGVMFQVIPPFLTKLIVDEVIGQGRTDKLGLYVGIMILTGALYLGMRLIHVHLSAWIGARIVSDLRGRLHTVLQYLKLNFFSRREPGEIVGRVMHDTGELLQFLVEGMPFLLVNTVSFLVIGVILTLLDWQLALMVFLPVPVFIFGSQWFWRRLRPLFNRQGSSIAHMHSVLNESLHGLKVVKAFTQEKRRTSQFEAVNGKLKNTHVRINRTFGSFNEVMFWFMNFGVALVWLFAVRRITGVGSTLTLGDLLAFVGYIWLFYGPLQWFSIILNWMSHAFSGAERIFEIIDSRTELEEHPEAVHLPVVRGAIEFRDVHFSYERGKEALRGVSFTIKPGEIIGLVGKSGAGKSTLINLLSRFFDPDSGEILLDGVPLNRIHLAQLRRSMGIVLQEPFLFNTSIAENIAFGKEDAGFQDIVAAAKAAHAHEFIVKKNAGYDTVVGEHGVKLSGGEKQRISIARAVLHNPPILILDEATSSVDASTEKQIQEAINNLIQGRTTIAIAHRLSTLRNADRLIVLENGKIAEMGTHEELMAQVGIYQGLAKAYTEMNTLKQVVWGG